MAVPLLPTTAPLDIVFVVEGGRLLANKKHLAVQSPFFDVLFFGDFVEKGKEEVEIKGVVYGEFLDLLHATCNGASIKDDTVLHLLKLADQFQMEALLAHCEYFLLVCLHSPFSNRDKIVIADQYNLDRLRKATINSMTLTEKKAALHVNVIYRLSPTTRKMLLKSSFFPYPRV